MSLINGKNVLESKQSSDKGRRIKHLALAILGLDILMRLLAQLQHFR
jgi:hypothetical protein